MNLSIRESNPEDLDQYTNLLQRTYQDTYMDESIGLTPDCFSMDIFTNEDTQKYLKSLLVNNNLQKNWLAFDNEKLVGSITCIIKNDDEAEITGFYVYPDNQGQGIGKKLYELALNFSENRDLLLDIYVHNTKTIKLYEKWGWKLDRNRGDSGFFFRHWPEWPDNLEAKCQYMKLTRNS